MEVLSALCLCAGIGGIELGLSLVANVEPVCFVESDPYCQRVLKARYPNAFLWDDVTTFPAHNWRGVDLVTAGFPCQPWSVAGARKGTNDTRWLWPRITEIIRVVGPRYVFLENVPGLLVGGIGPVLGDLATLGFSAEWGVFSCAGMGAPQRRERVFILAYSNSADLREQPVTLAGGSGAAESGWVGEDVGKPDCTRQQGRREQRARLLVSRREGMGHPACHGREEFKQEELDEGRSGVGICPECGRDIEGGRCDSDDCPGQMGDSNLLGGCGDLRERTAETEGPGRKLEHRGQGREAAGERPGRPLRADEALAYPDQQRLEERPITGRDGTEELAPPVGGGAELANSESPRGRRIPDEPGQIDSYPRGANYAIWPPGPEGDWGSIAPGFWPTEPGVCRVASGVSDRLERSDRRARLKALGNSVSAIVAAAAWAELSRRIKCR